MAEVKVKKVQAETKAINVHDVIAQFCYYFPQYTFSQARRLPQKRIIQMLRVVEKEEAKRMYQLTEIVLCPHVKNKNAGQDLLNHYKTIIDK